MRTVAIVSGGMDSTTLVAYLKSQGEDVLGLGFDYGQRHSIELNAAYRAMINMGVPFRMVILNDLARLLKGSSQTDPTVPVPHGHYEDETMRLTVVPNRNMIMLAVAAGYAIAERATTVAFGAHAGDHAIYPDCRPEFATAMNAALALCHYDVVTLRRPFITKTKAEICALGAELDVPFHLTYSCYEGNELHCGKCGTCVERKEAFRLAGVEDPTQYKDDDSAR